MLNFPVMQDADAVAVSSSGPPAAGATAQAQAAPAPATDGDTAGPLASNPLAAARDGAEGAEGAEGGDLAWRIVGLANLYRLLLPPALYFIEMLTRPTPEVGASQPRVFIIVCIVYWVLGGLYAFGGRGRWPNRRVLVFANTLLDASAISALLYCSGGVSSGLGILLVIPVGAMALLAEGAASLAVAAIATLALLTQQILIVIFAAGSAGPNDYSLAGILGAVLFIVALSAWPLSRRLSENEALMRRQEVDLANLAQLSQY